MSELYFTRDRLYEAVWLKPLSHISKDLDIAKDSIAFACTELKVPRPESGYWNKIKKEPSLPKPSLPLQVKDGRTGFDFTPYILGGAARASLNGKLGALHISVEKKSFHPTVKRSIKNFRKATPDDRKVLIPGNDEHLDIRVTKKSLDRANSIMNTLLHMFDALGWTFTIDTDRRTSMSIKVNGINIYFYLMEWIKREDYQLTKAEQSRRDKGHFVYTQKYSLVATGKLFLKVENTLNRLSKSSFKDNAKMKLEEQLISFCSALLPISRSIMAKNAEDAEWNRVYNLKRKREQDIRDAIIREENARQQLEVDTENWHKAERLRAFISAKHASNSAKDIEQWVTWSHKYADSIDPLTKQPKDDIKK